MKTKNIIFKFFLALIFLAPQVSLLAQESSSSKGQISLFGNVGISSAYGEYPSEYNPSAQFSFHPGLRICLKEILNTKMLLFIDCGYLEIAYKGFVGPTDTYFYNNYKFLSFNAMGGVPLGKTAYLSGGLYYAKSLKGNSYREYTDSWINLNTENDFGLMTEIGKNLGDYFTIGIQGRFGLKSIGEKVDVKTWALHGKIGINIFKF